MSGINISDRRLIARMTATASASGFGHTVPLLAAAQSGLITLVIIDRQAGFPRGLRQVQKPTLILIGDDDYRACGPTGWACATSARTWAKRVVIHGAGGTPSEYRKAVYDCLDARKLVFIETSSDHVEGWARFFAKALPIPIDLILPRNGQHPVLPSRKETH